MDNETTLQTNCRLRLAQLNTTWEEICTKAGETPVNVRGWVSRGSMNSRSQERLSAVLGVPIHALLDPSFNPKDWPIPAHMEESHA